MKVFLILILFFLVKSTRIRSVLLSLPLQVEWENWKTKYGKEYQTVEDEQERLIIWESNYRTILYDEAMQPKSHRIGLNEFSDWTDEELRRLVASRTDVNLRDSDLVVPAMTFEGIAPRYVNWVHRGFVTEVGHQGRCRSSCFFSATGVLEAQLRKQTGILTKLSEQYLVDCSIKNGCKARCSPNLAMTYMSLVGFISDAEYPYEAEAKKCRKADKRKLGYSTGFIPISPNDEESLKVAVAGVGPISVHIHATKNFISYKSGVFYDPSCTLVTRTNHAVLIVGYGSDRATGMDYWLVKNSWGPDWGENGYIRMARNQNSHCGIASFPSFAKITSVSETFVSEHTESI